MGKEIDLLENYPKTKRDIEGRIENKTEQHRKIARKFDKEFFDGSRETGYGGYYYNAKYWEAVIPTFKKHWALGSGDSILDIGCGKGFMLFDLQRLIPGVAVNGIDISQYAIDHSLPEVADYCQVGNASSLPFDDKSIDVVISITTVHNLRGADLIQALQEIERVSRRGSFITVDAFRNADEEERMRAWNLTAKTILHVDEWRDLFLKAGYTGDYFWFMP
jgi:SAM-dependent methyltransferase